MATTRSITKMTENELKALVDQEVSQSLGYVGRLSEQRRTALEYYLVRPSGKLAPPEVEGRSSVVSPDVANAIEWAMPSLMRIFTSGEQIARFGPRKPGDEKAADQATEYCNWLMWNQNEGYRTVYWWVKDALLSKNGYLKVYSEEKEEVTREEYEDQSMEQLTAIMQPSDDDETIEVESQEQEVDESFTANLPQMQQQLQQAQEQFIQAQQAGNQQAAQQIGQMIHQMEQVLNNPPMTYDITIKRIRKVMKTRVENVPPEEILVSRRAKGIEDTPFIAHRVRKRVGDIVAMGYDKDLALSLTDDNNWAQYNSEAIMRRVFDDEAATQYEDGGNNDPYGRYVWLIDAYVQVDYDGDGILEWRRILKAGSTILENEMVDGHPFVDMSPILLPHRHFGLSLADITLDWQTIKTQLLRQYLDALYLGNNPRYEVVEGAVNLDDMLTSRPGSIVRTKQPGMVSPMQTADISQSAVGGLEYFSKLTDERTGITKYNQGLDSDTLNQTATGIDLIQQSAMQRLELMARTMAETGFRRLFKLLLKEATTFQNKKQTIMLNGKWVDIDPREWRNGFDLTIDVGIGTGNRDAQAKQLGNILQLQSQLLSMGIATPQNIYYTASKIPAALGHKDAEQFFTDPSKGMAPPQQNPEMMKIQGQMQIEQMKGQMSAQVKAAELQHNAQLEQAKMQYQMQIDQVERDHQAQLEHFKAQMAAQVANAQQAAQAEQTRMQMEQQAQLKQYEAQLAAEQRKMELDAEMQKARLEAETKVLVAQIAASSKPAEPDGDEVPGSSPVKPEGPDTGAALAVAIQGFTAALGEMRRPKTVKRDPDTGAIIGVE